MDGGEHKEDRIVDYRTEMQSKIPPKMYLTLHIVDRVFTTVWLLIKSGFWLGVAYIVYLCVKSLAGQTTVANFILGYFASEKNNSSSSSPVVWILVSFAFFIWAKFERWLRLRKVASMSARIKQLETAKDRGRTSSGLTESGETPLEERLP